MATKNTGAGSMFGDEARRRLAGRERELFPRLVRPSVLVLLWVGLVLAFAGIVTVSGLLAGLLGAAS